MRILIILGHPDPQSLNHAIAHAVCEELGNLGHDVCFHDLYAERFDPLLSAGESDSDHPLSPQIAAHCADLESADGIVIVHPNWWGQPPAILKGWIDRVFRAGRAYRFEEGDSGEGIPVGLLKASCAVVFNTSNTPEVREQAVFGDPLEAVWKNCIFDLCGVRRFHRRMFTTVVTSSEAQRLAWIEEARDICRRVFPWTDTVTADAAQGALHG